VEVLTWINIQVDAPTDGVALIS